MRRILRAGVFILSFVILMSFASTAQAAGYFLNFKQNGAAFCSNTSTSIPESFTYNIPAGSKLTETITVNGSVIYNITAPSPIIGSGSSGGNAGFAFPFTAYPYTYVLTLSFNFGGGKTYTNTFKLVCNGGVATVTITNGNGASSGSGNGPIFDDGRLNMDALETAAIYCETNGSIRVYVPSTPRWIIAFDASPAEIAKVPTKPEKNTLIKSGKGAFLYRLTTGELQINATNDYVFIFKDCPKPQ